MSGMVERAARAIPLPLTIDYILEHYAIPEPNSGCWLCCRRVEKNGYGVKSYQGKTYTAHRLTWLVVHGSIPVGKFVLHKCDNPLCCNPGHLFTGSHIDNMRDMKQKGRGSNVFIINRIMTHIEAEEIRKIFKSGCRHNGVKALSRRYETSPATVRRIVLGKSHGLWTTPKEQQRNKKNNHLVNWRGKKLSVYEWAEILGLKPNTLLIRLRRKWSVERAMTHLVSPNVLLKIAKDGGAT